MNIEDINDLDPEFVLVAGDWHGNKHYAHHVIRHASEAGIKVILHVGDFGWAFGRNSGKFFDKPLRLLLEKYDIIIIWIDGNHDNHEKLQSLPVREDGFVQTGKGGRLYWAPRGHRWVWRNQVFAALGGAFSINFNYLTEGLDLFSDLEQVEQKDVDKLGNEKVNVLLTHEVPLGVPVDKQFTLPGFIEEASEVSRVLLRKAVNNTIPDFVFSGHWHQRKHYEEVYSSGTISYDILNKEYDNGNHLLLQINEFPSEIVKHDVGYNFKDAKLLIRGITEYDEEA